MSPPPGCRRRQPGGDQGLSPANLVVAKRPRGLTRDTKTGISSLELSRHLGVKYDTAWLMHNKILRAMSEREEAYVLRGRIQLDDAYLGGELPGGKAGRGSENKVPIVAAVSLSEAGHPIHAKITPVRSFSSGAISTWASQNLSPGSAVLTDGPGLLPLGHGRLLQP